MMVPFPLFSLDCGVIMWQIRLSHHLATSIGLVGKSSLLTGLGRAAFLMRV
jgi:hypothetical protein